VVGEAADGQTAVAEARRLRPDLVLMDVRMPGTDGIEATERLTGPGVPDPVPVPVVTTFDLDEYVFAALRAGAGGFLLRDVEPDELVARGLSNAGIGQQLSVSPSTVKTHVGSLLAQLGCRDRVQAVVYAYEHGVVTPGEDATGPGADGEEGRR
jgi:DNA-binding NarL/FixJ family response regulator